MLENARKNAKTVVNLAMVYAFFEIGRMIIEEEQNGDNRAAYEKQNLKELSDQFENFPIVSTGRKFLLSWSQFRISIIQN